MTDEIERLKQQHKAELDLAQEVIVKLRRDLARAHKRIHSQDAVWNGAIDAAASEADALANSIDTIDNTIAKMASKAIRTLMRPMI